MTSNLDLMREIDEAWNAQNWAAYEALLAPDLVAWLAGDDQPHGRADHVARGRDFFLRFPENRVVADHYLTAFEGGDRTCTIARLTGRMTVPLKLPDGSIMAATQRTFDVMFSTVCRWRDGVIAEQYEFMDQQGLFRAISG